MPNTFDDEEIYYDRKQYRKERKIAAAKDRSKYKKTDLEKKERKKERKNLGQNELRGRVLAILPECVLVDAQGKEYSCVLRGVLKKERTKKKNLIAVGDFVHFIPHEGSLGSILHIEDRYSILSRAEHLTKRKEQLLACNIDQVLITVSLFIPRLKPALIDRYIIAAIKGNMHPIIVINKVDLVKTPTGTLEKSYIEEEIACFEEVQKVYKKLEIPLICVSAKTKEGLPELHDIMLNKASVFSGQSGVGKSSLINATIGLDLRVGNIIERTRKGAHTTNRAILLPISEGGFCIDTPGIRSFGIWELSKDEIKMYFKEINAHSSACHFPNCTHTHEPNCQVKVALEQGEISPMRYKSYVSLIEGESIS